MRLSRATRSPGATWRGTQTGPLMGFPPSGNPAVVTGTIISRFVDGKWVEDYSNQDTFGMLQQMGIIPKMGS
jgi:predicted ester cyclase